MNKIINILVYKIDDHSFLTIKIIVSDTRYFVLNKINKNTKSVFHKLTFLLRSTEII